MIEILVALTLATNPTLAILPERFAIRKEEIDLMGNPDILGRYLGIKPDDTLYPPQRSQNTRGGRFCTCNGAGCSRGTY